MAGKTLSNAIDGLQSVLRQVCQLQTTHTDAIEGLSCRVDELEKSCMKVINGHVESTSGTQSFTKNDPDSINGKDATVSTSSEAAIASTQSAGKRLTDTYELLEMILLYLPEEALLCKAQRVSQHFRDTIKSSKPLQQKLFFAPLLPGAVPDDRPLQINPLLSKATELPLYYCPTSRRLRYRGGPERHQIRLEKPKSTTEYVPQVGILNDGADVEWVEVPVVAWKLLASAYSRNNTRDTVIVDGSWRRMLLTQPSHRSPTEVRLVAIMADSTRNQSPEDHHAILSRMCESQVALTQAVTSLTHTVAELVTLKSETNSNISDLVKARNVQPQHLDGPAKQLTTEFASSAGRRLTDTYELLEMILLNLPMDTLLFSQRVSRNFCSTVATSKALQQRLFFAPLPGDVPDRPLLINPLLSKVVELPLYYCPFTKRVRFTDRAGRQVVRCCKPEVKRSFSTAPDHITWSLDIHDKGHLVDVIGSSARIGHSWCKMLLAQQPHTCVLRLETVVDGRRQRLHAREVVFSTLLPMEKLLEPLM
ncbi:hypothetical protein LTR27_005959 [Elasticomyces elasticus]|nr:hypothetical protein LTR27_005959 [Elasticomyces elasticus]